VTLVWLLVALSLGLAVGANVAYRAMLVRCDLHDYRKIALEAARVRQVYADADHEHRLRLRTEAATKELRIAVGDLLDTVQAQDRQIAQLRQRRGPVPVYGIHRQAS
jgi:hypothetical protein